MTVYYDAYLAAHSDEPGEQSIEEQYKDLIQSQNGESGKDGLAAETQDLQHPTERDLDEDTVKIPVVEVDTQIGGSAPDIIDDLEI